MELSRIQQQPVKLSQKIDYHCKLCGACCRDVEGSVMLESLDLFRMARYFREAGHSVQTIVGILTAYTDAVPLTSLRYPIFLLKCTGPEQSCVFLKDNRCSIQPVKPRVCRIYPFTVSPGEDGKIFSYGLSQEQAHHFSGGQVSVND